MYDNWGKKKSCMRLEKKNWGQWNWFISDAHTCDDVRDWWLNLRDKTWMNFGIIWVFSRGRVIVSINNIKM